MNNPNHKTIYPRIMVWFTIVVVYVSIFLSLFGMEVTKIFSKGVVYWDAYKIIPILSLGIVFAMLKDSSSLGLQIAKRTKIIGIVLSVIAALNLALNVLLIPYFGAIGAACSSLISQIVYFIVIFAFAQKHYFIPYRLDKVILIITIGLVLVVSGYFFNTYSVAIRFSVKSALLVLFPVLLYFLRIFEKNEILALKTFVQSIKNTISPSSSNEIDEQISEYNE
jgi:O-antigen/teichoic acid export membrane protein